jgi:hypothetical protein
VAEIKTDLLFELKSICISPAIAGEGRNFQQQASVRRALEKLERILSRPLRIAILGEQNSGKSLLINYLLRHQILPSGGFSGESNGLLIRYAPEPSVYAISRDGSRNRLTSKAFGKLVKPEMRRPLESSGFIYDASGDARQYTYQGRKAGELIFGRSKESQTPSKLIDVGLPLPILKRLEFVEVRAFPDEERNSPISHAFRQVEATIWCTLATQAWKETEILAWTSVPPRHRKSALMFITYKDAIRRGTDEARILSRLRRAAGSLFDDITLVSLRDAVQSLLSTDAETAERYRTDSNIEASEKALIQMVESWQKRRMLKASRILRMAAAIVSQIGRRHEIVARLDRLSGAFLNVSPLADFSDRAA